MEVASSEAKINDCKGENILKVRGCSRLSLLLLRSVALALALPPRKRLHYVSPLRSESMPHLPRSAERRLQDLSCKEDPCPR
jgi:hypothetical protein